MTEITLTFSRAIMARQVSSRIDRFRTLHAVLLEPCVVRVTGFAPLTPADLETIATVVREITHSYGKD